MQRLQTQQAFKLCVDMLLLPLQHNTEVTSAVQAQLAASDKKALRATLHVERQHAMEQMYADYA